jgi:hypothetical protein
MSLYNNNIILDLSVHLLPEEAGNFTYSYVPECNRSTCINSMESNFTSWHKKQYESNITQRLNYLINMKSTVIYQPHYYANNNMMSVTQEHDKFTLCSCRNVLKLNNNIIKSLKSNKKEKKNKTTEKLNALNDSQSHIDTPEVIVTAILVHSTQPVEDSESLPLEIWR